MKNQDPVLVIMAAGMGSRYGGLKQLEPLGPDGEILMDYSVFDAARAGFSQVIFVIRRDFEEAFDRMMRPKLGDRIRFSYAFQDPDDLPPGFSTPAGRVKPWGTGQAVLAARDLIRGPFAVINADDYYGPSAFQAIFDFLSGPQAEKIGLCVWRLRDTLSDHGHVSRGVCDIDGEGRLRSLREIKRIERSAHGARYTLDGGLTYQALDPDSPVSMNFWGFPLSFMDELKAGFSQFLKGLEEDDPLTAEYLLPEVVSRALETGKTEVMAMPVEDAWYGVTNKEDKPRVEDALNQLAREGVYPTPLWP
jgi:NDP-sugar pyrophosphorylase family protein